MALDYFILNYIAYRMQVLGFKKYHFEPYMVVLGKTRKEMLIEGHNEYYYLTSKCLSPGSRIVSDSNAIEVKDYFPCQNFSKVMEFTGQLQLSIDQTTLSEVFEFIRVIPD